MTEGVLLVVSAPSGAGKTTLCRKLVEGDGRLRYLVSHTTRPPRPGEEDGRDYTFVSREEFQEIVERGGFAEWAEVHGNYYGTSLERLSSTLSEGHDVILDIDVQGARQIRGSGLNACYVFIMPPSMEELASRLKGRSSDSADVVRRRLEKAVEEIRACGEYDYVVVNDDIDEALDTLRCIITTVRADARRVNEAWVKGFMFDNRG